ncbi:hypothetical protein RESH_03389 [Rhodopirellula europaea SH398]|jgi:hypothetical protein|uniref:Uncharacterized protein n=1 Tax=Rhodopirellula europaea SH398 TaxID=1263868 RepID=M5SEC9_9BACT|nr:hypothetical protein RESH_03389 [Rhodopirellula europaea SH398]
MDAVAVLRKACHRMSASSGMFADKDGELWLPFSLVLLFFEE